MIEGAGAAVTPGWLFRISTVATLTGGAVFLIWLAERITARGLRNGLSLIMFCGIAAQLLPALTALLEQDRQGLLPPGAYFWQILAAAALAGVIVFVELAERRVPLQMANATAARAAPAYLSLKVNAGGGIPPVCAIALLTVPAGLLPGPATMLLLLALIVGLAFLFPRIALAPSEADELGSRGAIIPRIPAGDSTAAHLSFIQIRMATIGAIYLGVICLVPMMAASWMPAWPRLDGIAELVLVTATLDLFTSAGIIRHPAESPSR